MKACGDCSLCCKLIPVPVMDAPAGEWCRHACGAGCAIHPERPAYCRSFHCLWQQSAIMGPELQPHVCGVVFEAFHAVHTVVALFNDDGGGLAPMMLIQQMLVDGYAVWLSMDGGLHLLLPEGDTEASARARFDTAARGVLWPRQATHLT